MRTGTGALCCGISIHAPLAGCDDAQRVIYRIKINISIHAPLAGCDEDDARAMTGLLVFQSTHPLRGATDIRDIKQRIN